MKYLALIFTILSILVSPAVLAKNKEKPSLDFSRKPQSANSILKKCQAEVINEAAMLNSLERWIEQSPAVSGGRSFRTPTKRFGTWLELTLDTAGVPTLYVVSKETTKKIVFGPTCAPKTSHSLGLDFSRLNPDSLAKWFSDADLAKIINSGRSGIVYVWSPEMVYSAKFYRWFREVAKDKGMEFVPVIDPRTKLTLVDQMVKEYGITPSSLKLNSVELYMRNVTVHFPSTVVFKDGKLHEQNIVGVMSKEEIENEINQRLLDLESRKY